MSDPIRIFVGCSANTEDAESQAVLEYTLRSKTKREIALTWMKLSADIDSPFYCNPRTHEGWRTETWATPFSGFRWAIPHLCAFEGKAIYTDSDVIFFADVAELWDQEFEPGKVVLAKAGADSWRYCVSLWECSRVRPYIPTLSTIKMDPEAHHKLCRFFAASPHLVQAFSGNWNCLDGEKLRLDDPQIKVLHYTDMSTQPHLKRAMQRLSAKGMHHWYDGPIKPHKRPDVEGLFAELLFEAETNGYPVERYEQQQMFGEYKKANLMGYKGGR